MMNIRIQDNGSAYMITVNGLIVAQKSSLGDAWRHIKWMYEIAQQNFTVGEEEVPVIRWLHRMRTLGDID